MFDCTNVWLYIQSSSRLTHIEPVKFVLLGIHTLLWCVLLCARRCGGISLWIRL